MPIRLAVLLLCAFLAPSTLAQVPTEVVDIPTRPGVSERMVVLAPEHPHAAVLLFAGGHGGLGIFPNGSFRWGEGNFLVRTRARFAAQGLLVAVLDAPSDRQSAPYLGGFRQTPEHVADVKAAIAWLRTQAPVPVWLVGTSRGTQSVAYVATVLPLAGGGPDGIVLTSTILSDPKSRAVPELALEQVHVPVLVVHHAHDGCEFCRPDGLPRLMDKLAASPRRELITVDGGSSRGDPCEGQSYHGYLGIEDEVVRRIAGWIGGTPG